MSTNPWWEAPPAGARTVPGWQPFDFVVQDFRTVPSIAGEALTATLGPVFQEEIWAVTRSTIAAIAADDSEVTTASKLRHYLDVARPPVISGSNSGSYDEADFPYPGLWVPAGRSLLAVWSGVEAGAHGVWHVQFVRLKRGG